jgi:hypothetical protein
MRWTPVALFVGFASVAMIPSGGVETAPQSATEQGVLEQDFARRVGAYVELHRHIERLLPEEVVTSDPARLLAPRLALAREMRAARHGARRGDIFAPPLEKYFRTLIARTLQRAGIRDLLTTIEDENTVHTPASVNGEYPAGRSLPCMPPSLLAALPPLPPELRYSFVGRDLILWDVHAGLIVDFVPRAVPRN